MVSKRRLNKPCPCGSGEKYGDCCAPQNHRKKRRRRKKRRGSPEPKSSRPPDALEAYVKRTERFQPHFSQFTDTFAHIFNSTFASIEARVGCPLQVLMADDLEVIPDNAEVTHGQLMLLYSWYLYRDPKALDFSRSELLDRVVRNLGADAKSVVETMDDATFGAWRVRLTTAEFEVTAVDGRDRPRKKKTLVAVDNNWHPLANDGIFLGWVAEIAGENALFFAHPLTNQSEKRLLDAAERSAWGRGSQFRTDHYEADILALMLSSHLEPATEGGGRVFIEDLPTPPPYEQLPPIVLDELGSRIWSDGLTETPPALPGTWSSQAARAIDEKFDALTTRLRGYLDDFLVGSWWFSDEEAEHMHDLVTDGELATLVHLTPDGEVDHPAARHWDCYPITVLDLDTSAARRMGLRSEWSIEHALRWGRQHLDDADLETLEEAATKHRIAMRWVGIVALNIEMNDFPVSQIQFQDLFAGIRDFFPDWAAKTPMTDLRDQGRGTWKRLASGMRKAYGLDAEAPLLIEDLPQTYMNISSLPGVGEATIRNTWLGLVEYVVNWPDSAGYHPVTSDQQASREAISEIESGLDDLDELF